MLRRLRDLPDYEVATGQPDVRGWTVRGGDGRPFATVHELIVDPEALKVRYLDLELDNPSISEEYRHILLPIGVATPDEEGNAVFVPQLNAQTVLDYPPYVEIEVSREYEESMRRALGLVTTGADYYAGPEYESGRFYTNR